MIAAAKHWIAEQAKTGTVCYANTNPSPQSDDLGGT